MRGDLPTSSDFDAFPAHSPATSVPVPRAATKAPPVPPLPGFESPPPPPASVNPAPVRPVRSAPQPSPKDDKTGRTGVSPAAKWGIGIVVAIVCVSLALFGLRIAREVSSLTVIDDLEVGDCLQDHFQGSGSAEEGEFFSILFVSRASCSDAHAYEMYAKNTTLWEGNAPYPGVDAVFQDGEQFCRDQFDQFVGGDYFTSPFDFFTFVPPAEVWADGGRDVRCLVGYADRTSLAIGSLEGAGSQTGS